MLLAVVHLPYAGSSPVTTGNASCFDTYQLDKCMMLLICHTKGPKPSGNVMIRYGTPLEDRHFLSISPKTITHFAITAPPI